MSSSFAALPAFLWDFIVDGEAVGMVLTYFARLLVKNSYTVFNLLIRPARRSLLTMKTILLGVWTGMGETSGAEGVKRHGRRECRKI